MGDGRASMDEAGKASRDSSRAQNSGILGAPTPTRHPCERDIRPVRTDRSGRSDRLRSLGDTPQCPLHFAMQRLAETAVSQLVYYADGEYVPRPDLLRDLERWQRLHRLIAGSICPASRAVEASAADLCAALALIPEAQFTAQREMLSRCAARGHGDACPLEREAGLNPFGGE